MVLWDIKLAGQPHPVLQPRLRPVQLGHHRTGLPDASRCSGPTQPQTWAHVIPVHQTMEVPALLVRHLGIIRNISMADAKLKTWGAQITILLVKDILWMSLGETKSRQSPTPGLQLLAVPMM